MDLKLLLVSTHTHTITVHIPKKYLSEKLEKMTNLTHKFKSTN